MRSKQIRKIISALHELKNRVAQLGSFSVNVSQAFEDIEGALVSKLKREEEEERPLSKRERQELMHPTYDPKYKSGL